MDALHETIVRDRKPAPDSAHELALRHELVWAIEQDEQRLEALRSQGSHNAVVPAQHPGVQIKNGGAQTADVLHAPHPSPGHRFSSWSGRSADFVKPSPIDRHF